MKGISDMFTAVYNNKAFTLIEAMVALVLLSIAILGFYRIHIKAVELADFNKDMLIAEQFARSKAEFLKSIGYASAVALGSGNDTSLSASDSIAGNIFFQRSWTITPYLSNGITDTNLITIRVGWDSVGQCSSISSCDFTYNIHTFISRKSIY